MATEIVKEWIDENGRRLREYASGAILDVERGRFTGNNRPPITVENSSAIRAKYIEKTRGLLRQEISKAIFGDNIANKPAAAVAAVGGELFRDIAANKEAHPRYRLETWQAVARHAGLLDVGGAAASADNSGGGGQLGASVEAAARILEIIQAEIERQRRNDGAIDV